MLKLCLIALISLTLTKGQSSNRSYDVTILYTSSLNEYEERRDQYTRCRGVDGKIGKCTAGWPRLVNEVKLQRNNSKGAIFNLNLGGAFYRTIYFVEFRSAIMSELMTLLKPDCVTIGQTDIFLGRDEMLKYLNSLNCPCVCTNVDVVGDKEFRSTVSKHAILTKNNLTIGILGFIDPSTEVFVFKSTVLISPIIPALKRECEILRNKADFVVAMGDVTFHYLAEIAHEVPCINVILTSDDYTFLYNGIPPENRSIAISPYPYPVNNKGRVALIGGACSQTMYLGKINVEFNDVGETLSWTGNPIYMSADKKQDEDTLRMLSNYTAVVKKFYRDYIGIMKVLLNSGNCENQECTAGNFICNSLMKYSMHNRPDNKNDLVCLLHSESIGKSINGHRLNRGQLSMGDIQSLLSYNNDMYYITITGHTLIRAFESAFHNYGGMNTLLNAFLQTGGMRVEFDPALPPGRRVVYAEVLCTTCRVPSYKVVDPYKNYSVITSWYLGSGGNRHPELLNHTDRIKIKDKETVMVAWYAQHFSPLYPELDGRIKRVSILSGAIRISPNIWELLMIWISFFSEF